MSQGWGFDFLFCLEGRVFVHNDCPGERVFAPFKSCPGGGGMVLDEIDTCIRSMYSSHLLESDFALTTGKHTQMTKENSKGMKDLSASNVSHVSRKPLRCIHITTPYAGHVFEVTFRNPSQCL